ncbi:hypothetical protein RHMOL_Rhmol07G0012500 [Rhododendron molle]|uniref:Uncharacterized protein n=1 Tax=Rhododendron molle TaxID=49168 RepID=A0ACC0MVJ3_RHOML|nr:hypothetical protein RHMOL_Rhmol07G0012500 [Rhododendron molle]
MEWKEIPPPGPPPPLNNNPSDYLFTPSFPSTSMHPPPPQSQLLPDNIDWVSLLSCPNGRLSDTKPLSPYAAAHYDGMKDERERKRGSRVRKATRPRFAFQTKSADDILDDGYRWRKYGQKAVKNSIYPSRAAIFASIKSDVFVVLLCYPCRYLLLMVTECVKTVFYA